MGSKALAKGLVDEQPVTGIMVSTVSRLIKNPKGINAVVQVVELNVMLGKPEGLTKAPLLSPKQREHQQLMSTSFVIPIGTGPTKQLGEGT